MKLNSLFTKLSLSALILSLFIISSCNKNADGTNADMCTKVKQIKIKAAKTTYYVGQTISLYAATAPDGNYTWYQGQYSGIISSSTMCTVSYCNKSNSGWYYLTVTNTECNNSGRDSIYINVINNPDSAACSPTDNTISFSSIPDIAFTNPTWGIDPNYNIKLMRGYQDIGYPDLGVYFDSYWNTHEPEDGAYNIAGLYDLSSTGSDVYRVAIKSLYSSIDFASNSGKVYVSHPGGKMRVTFCSIPMSGYWGSTVNTVATGRMTAQ